MVSISDRAKALIALESERVLLYAQARRVSNRQQALIEDTARRMRELSNDHYLILAKLAEIKYAANAIALGDL